MTDREFIEAILADPADDAPRLIYADWLDENGDADRAEFIRVQCELATKDPKCERASQWPKACVYFSTLISEQNWCVRCKRWEALRRRERELLIANALRWFEEGEFDPDNWGGIGYSEKHFDEWHGGWICDSDKYINARFVRGLVGRIELAADDCIAQLDAIIELHPIREVTLMTWPGEWNRENTECLLSVNGRIARSTGHSTTLIALDCLRSVWPGIKFTLPRMIGRDTQAFVNAGTFDQPDWQAMGPRAAD